MANRRMFSSRITESAKFLKMPPSSQSLYFHLGMKADDDGIVEAYPIMLMTSSTEDDLKILISKGFVTVLNEDLVIFIDDWMENNNIRADRKIDSIYKDLLLQIVPDARLKQPKPSYYSRRQAICQTSDGQAADKCQANVGIGKDRLGKDSISTVCSEPDKSAPNQSGILIPLNDKTLYDVPMDKVALWKESYPAVDVEQELRKMAAWSHSNPTRRKTRRGVDRFINAWLSKEQDKGGSMPQKGGDPVGAESKSRGQAADFYKQFLGTGDGD